MTKQEKKPQIILPDVYGEIEPFSISFTDWVEKYGFFIRDTWDNEKRKWSGAGWLVLQPTQKRIFDFALQQNEDHEFRYSTVLFSTIKKSGKTLSGAAVAAWYAEACPAGSELFLVANDLEQAEGRMMKDLKYHAQIREYKINKYEIELPNGTTIKVLAQSYKSVAGSRHALVLFDELWGINCTDTETECYTRSGWKKFDEVGVGEDIATINPESLKFEWKPTQKVNVSHYKGQMCSFDHRRVNMLFTPNHRVFGRFRQSGQYRLDDMPLEFRTAAEAVTSYEMRMPVATGFEGKREDTFTVPGCVYKTRDYTKIFKPRDYPMKSFMKLLGYYLSEGWLNYYDYKDIHVPLGFSIGQILDKHPEEYMKIQETLKELKILFTKDKTGFKVQSKRLGAYFEQFGLSYNKFIPQEIKDMDQEYLKELFLAFMDGDGWKAGKGWQTELASKRLIDDLVEIGIKIGYIAKYMGKRWRVIKHEDKTHWMYRASFSLGNVTLDRRNMKVVKDWEGTVWCPTVENGTWLARKNGTVFWTGNSELTRRTYEELTPIPTIPWSLRFIATYAGFINESDLLWDLYLSGVGKDEHEDGKGQLIKGMYDIPVWENGKQFTYWNHEPIMPWQDETYYQSQRETLRAAAYLRLHENRWVTTHEEFIPIDWWDYAAAQFEGSAELWKDHPYAKFPLYLGIDAAPKKDSTAVVACCYDSSKGIVVDVMHKIWTPTDGQLDFDITLKSYIIWLYTNYNVVSISYDPAHLYQLMLQLGNVGYPVNEYTQTLGNMTKASQNLYDLLKFRRLYSYKDDEARTHVQNTVAQSETNGFRIVKQKATSKGQSKPMDYTLALSIAAYKAVEGGGVDVSIPIEIISPFSDVTGYKPENKGVPWMFQSD